MSPFSGPVLVGAALVSSPAVWHAIEGTAPVETALTRFLLGVVICWVALGVLAAMVGPAPRPEPLAAGSDEVRGLDEAG